MLDSVINDTNLPRIDSQLAGMSGFIFGHGDDPRGVPGETLFDRSIQASFPRRQGRVERDESMRRIDRRNAQPAGGQSSQRTPFGAVTVNQVDRSDFANATDEPQQIGGVQRMHGSPHR